MSMKAGQWHRVNGKLVRRRQKRQPAAKAATSKSKVNPAEGLAQALAVYEKYMDNIRKLVEAIKS